MASPEDVQRLGRRQLGRHAYEKHMPGRVRKLIAEDTGKGRLPGIVPLLARLLDCDLNVDHAWLCNDTVTHVYKVSGEGDHFCGYHNIQMILGTLESCGIDLSADLARPTVLDLQSMIEKAWILGFNAYGLIETGGIRDTRKHIGTSEAQALFQSLKIPCRAKSLPDSSCTKPVYEDLLDHVERYYSSAVVREGNSNTRIHQTTLPPMYVQRPRHSLTIVGIERRHDGSRALLVFDPGYEPPKTLLKLNGGTPEPKQQKVILKAYRKEEKYLKRYSRYEVLQIDPT